MDIADFLRDKLGIKGRLMGSGWYAACCPIHGEDSPSFGVRTQFPQFFNCFSCGEHGSLQKLVTIIKKWSYEKAAEFIKKYIHIDVSSLKNSKKRKPLEIPSFAIKLYEEALPKSIAYKYAKSRGISDETLHAYAAGFDRLNRRLVIPYHDVRDGKIIGFDARLLFSLDDVEKDSVIETGLKNVAVLRPRRVYRSASKLRVIITEGMFDAMKVYQWVNTTNRDHYPIAFGGRNISREQLNYIASFDEIVCGFDMDDWGIKTTRLLRDRFKGIPLRRLYYEGKDPGEADLRSFEIGPMLLTSSYKNS